MQWILLFSVCLTGAAVLTNSEPEIVLSRGKTSQSSTYKGNNETFDARRATDGDQETCAHTQKEKDPWWIIDLLGVYNITNISIYNKDGDTKPNLANATIRIGYSGKGNNNKVCVTNIHQKIHKLMSYKCDAGPMVGRFVSIHHPGKKNLILCDVKITGTKEDLPNMKLYKKHKTWEEALDFCRGKHVDLASIHDEKTQALVELAARGATTQFVWLGLRYTCVLEFWFWVDTEQLNFKRWAPGNDTTPDECDMSGAMDTRDHQWVRLPENERLNFICVD